MSYYWELIAPGESSPSALSDLGWRVVRVSGAGYPPVDQISYVADPHQGAVFDGFKVRPRQVTLVLRSLGGLSALHDARRKLSDAVRPDLASSSPATLVYNGGGCSLRLDVHYAGGLEFGPQYNSEAVALRLVAYDPYWRSGLSSSATLSTSAQLPDGRYVYYRDASSSAWGVLGGLFAYGAGEGSIEALAAAGSLLYAGGAFDNIGGVTACQIAVYNGSSWSAVGGGMNGVVYAIAAGAGDKIYAGGSFTEAGGVSACRIAVYANGSWSSVGSGMNNTVLAVAVGIDGTLYAGGQFDQADGATACRIAAWDGSSWSDLDGGMDERVTAIVVGADGTVYACGYFTTAGSTTVNYIAAWNGSAWSDLGGGLDNYAYAMALAADGRLYVAGAFTTAGSQSVDGIAVWDGTSWSSPPGLDLQSATAVYELGFDADGVLYFSGDFILPGTIWMEDAGFARYNGAIAYPPDIDLPPAGAQQYAGPFCLYDNKLAFGGYAYTEQTIGSGSPVAAGISSVSAAGDAYVFPSITIRGPGVVRSIRNETTGEELLLDLDILDGETITIGLDPLDKSIVSDWRGDVLRDLLPNSDFATWHLAPGANKITALVADSGSATSITITWRDAWWSLDGVNG